MKKLIAYIPCMIALIFTGTLFSCNNYYKAIPVGAGNNTDKAAAIEKMSKVNRYFILRNGQQSYAARNIEINDEKKLLYCTLDSVSPEHTLHFRNGRGGAMRYKPDKMKDRGVITEAHLFIQPDTVPAKGKYSLPLDKIQKIEMLGHDNKRTQQNHTLAGIGFTILGVGILASLIAVTASFSGL